MPRPRVSAEKPSPAIRAYASLERIDYAGGFRVQIARAGDRSAESWLRGIFESMPAPPRLFVFSGWRLLGARLGPRHSPDHVLGWPIEDSGPSRARLRSEWRIGLNANLVLVTEPAQIAFATLVEHRGFLSRLVWTALIPIHLVIIRYALARSAAEYEAASE